MAFAPVILQAAFSLAMRRAGCILPKWGPTLPCCTHPWGAFPPPELDGTLSPEVPGASPPPLGKVAGFPFLVPLLDVCLVLAICNISLIYYLCQLTSHYPTQCPNSIHTANSIFVYKTHSTLGFSISCITLFHAHRRLKGILAHGGP